MQQEKSLERDIGELVSALSEAVHFNKGWEILSNHGIRKSKGGYGFLVNGITHDYTCYAPSAFMSVLNQYRNEYGVPLKLDHFIRHGRREREFKEEMVFLEKLGLADEEGRMIPYSRLKNHFIKKWPRTWKGTYNDFLKSLARISGYEREFVIEQERKKPYHLRDLDNIEYLQKIGREVGIKS